MKKIFIFLALFLLTPFVVFAQTPTTTSGTVLINQLGDSTADIIKESQIRRCLTFTQNTLGQIDLSGKDFPINSEVNIVSCLQTADNFLCTTGKSDLDSKLNITVSGAPAFSVIGDNPIYTTSGRVSAKANLTINPGEMYYFYGVVLKTTTNNKGEATSIQLTDFDFPDGNLANCQGLMINPETTSSTGDGGTSGGEGGDPYGRIFDAKSLEPIPNISISILDSNKKTLIIPLVVNPQITKEDGVFNFVVPSGTYYLSPSFSKYKLASIDKINANYKKAYSDILTSVDEQIIEKVSDPAHRDVALDPGTSAPYKSNAVKITYGTLRNGNNMVITGRVSHPLTIVHFLQNSKEIAKTVANRWGAYSVIISGTKISSDSQIEVAFEKVDLTKNTTALNNQEKFIKEVMAAESTTTFNKSSSFFVDPIPAYIEGVATDSSGRIIADADIKIKIKNSTDTYFETKADTQGVFKISPSSLPQFNYIVEIINPKTKQITKLTTYQLSKANSIYLAQNKINLITASKNNKSLIQSSTKTNTSTSTSSTNNNQNEQIKNSPLTKSNSVLFTLIILFTIICLIGVTLIFLYKKNKEHNA